jgi:hypothetical protein
VRAALAEIVRRAGLLRREGDLTASRSAELEAHATAVAEWIEDF